MAKAGMILAALPAALMLASGCPCTRGASAPQQTPAAWVELFTDQDWNDVQPGQGVIFKGTVRYVPGDDQPSFVMRYNPYKLAGPDGGLTDIYCGSDSCLSPWVGRSVEIEGTLQTMEIEGTVFVEIWPARIRPAPGVR